MEVDLTHARIAKRTRNDLAIHGGRALFDSVVSTSNLVRPDVQSFLSYSSQILTPQAACQKHPLASLLEQRLADFHGTRRCISFANGFWAIALAIRATALPGKSEVIMPSLTYRRLADIVAWTGLIPHFCEVDARTLAISAATASDCINERTALLLGVHPIVNTCDTEGLEQLSSDRGIPLLFDAVESAYETVAGRRVGGFGRAECFSMHASKLINGFEGGYITTNDEALADELERLRDLGTQDDGGAPVLRMNARLNGLHAAMAMACLDDLERQVDRNRLRYRAYQQSLETVPGLRLLPFQESEATSFKTIVVELLDDWPYERDRTVDILNAERILARSYYATPLHQKHAQYPVVPVSLPLSDRLAQRHMLLPCGHFVSATDIHDVARLLRFMYEVAAVAEAAP